MGVRERTKRILWPGLDLHTRDRRRALTALLRDKNSRVLDAGCGNGYLALEAARRGAEVVAVSNDLEQIERNRDFFRFLGETRVTFEHMNLYDIAEVGGTFDQIFCIEVLEHLTRDFEVVAAFRTITRPQGQLVVCCPNSTHPEHALGRIDEPENGWHVRDGYTEESYRELVEPNGFALRRVFGIGGPVTTRVDRVLRSVRHLTGEGAAIPVFLATAPLARLDRSEPKLPYSLAGVADAV